MRPSTIIASLLFFLAAASAGAADLAGTVTDSSGTPLQGVLVEVLAPGTTTVLSSATTDGVGAYATGLFPDGTADVRATPPPATGLGAALIPGVPTVGPTPLDVVLVGTVAQVTVDGTLSDDLGPLDGACIRISGVAGSAQQCVGPSGAFSLQVPAGTYFLSLDHNAVVNGPAPEFTQNFLELFSDSVVVSGDLTLPLVIPNVPVDIRVEDDLGSIVPNATAGVSFTSVVPFTTAGVTFSGNAFNGANVGADGLATVRTPPRNGSVTVTANPPAGVNLLPGQTPGVTIAAPSSAATVVLPTPPPAVTFDGVISNGVGTPLGQQCIRITGNAISEQVCTGPDGVFSFSVPQGTYSMFVSGNRVVGSTQEFQELFSDSFPLTVDTTIALQIPTHRVRLTVEDSGGASVVGATASLQFYNVAPFSTGGIDFVGGNAFGGGTTDAQGLVVLHVPPSSAATTAFAQPPAGAPLQPNSVPGVVVDQDRDVTIVLPDPPPPVSLSLDVRDHLGSPLGGVCLRLNDGLSTVTGCSDAAGDLDFEVPEGNYNFFIDGNVIQPGVGPAFTQRFFELFGTVALFSDVTSDLVLSRHTLRVNVQDPQGNPVPGAIVGMGFHQVAPFSTGVFSVDFGQAFAGSNVGADGEVVLAMPEIAGTYSLFVQPPGGSGFGNLNIAGQTLTQNEAITIVLPLDLSDDDADDDGILNDDDNCVGIPNPDQADLDLDGAGDVCDADDDGDGVDDEDDGCPRIPNPGQEDVDLDGHPDACDNCPTVANADQADADEDGRGDVCENEAPIARCMDATLVADAVCAATVGAADVDDQSFDPDGAADVASVEVSPTSVQGVGNHAIQLTIEDLAGEADSCSATVTLVDVTPPQVVTAQRIEIPLPHDCVSPLPDLTGEARVDDNCGGIASITQDPPAGTEVPADHPIVVELTATDDAGNQTTVEVEVVLVGTAPLGPAGSFHVLAGQIDRLGGAVGGRVGAVGDADIRSFEVGHERISGPAPTVEVGGDLLLRFGQVQNGGVHAGGFCDLRFLAVDGPSDCETGAVDLDPVLQHLIALSDRLAADLAPNGDWTTANGRLTFRGTHPVTNVFSVDGATLESARNISFDVPPGSGAVVHVTQAAAVDLRWVGINIGPMDPSDVLWNLPRTLDLRLRNLGLRGTLLAPRAATRMRDTGAEGQAFVASLNAKGCFVRAPFSGALCPEDVVPVPPEPGACAVKVDVVHLWPGGQQILVTLHWMGPKQTDWTVALDMSGEVTSVAGWNGAWDLQGDTVVATGHTWNGILVEGQPRLVGANLTAPQVVTPVSATINGVTCTIE